MKKFVSVFLVLVLVLSMVPLSAFAAEVEPEATPMATAVTCSSCGSLCTYVRSYTGGGYEIIVWSCELSSQILHYHTRYNTVKVYTCNGCGDEVKTTTPFTDYCHVADENIWY